MALQFWRNWASFIYMKYTWWSLRRWLKHGYLLVQITLRRESEMLVLLGKCSFGTLWLFVLSDGKKITT